MPDSIRNATERAIAHRLVKTALARGMRVSVNDGEETTVSRSLDFNTILEAMASTDWDYLHFYDGQTGDRLGMVWLIWGNGEDLISDHSDNEKMSDLVKVANRD